MTIISVEQTKLHITVRKGYIIMKEKNDNQQKQQIDEQELLKRIDANREAYQQEKEESRQNINEAKQRLNEAYQRLAKAEQDKERRRRRADPATHTYTEEEKQEILDRCRSVTERYMKLKDFTERFEIMQQRREIEKIMSAAEQEKETQPAEAADDKKDE